MNIICHPVIKHNYPFLNSDIFTSECDKSTCMTTYEGCMMKTRDEVTAKWPHKQFDHET